MGVVSYPLRAFYENHATERVMSEKTVRQIRRPYRSRLLGTSVFLIVAIQLGGRMNIATTVPNASVVPVRDRIPLVLGSGITSKMLV